MGASWCQFHVLFILHTVGYFAVVSAAHLCGELFDARLTDSGTASASTVLTNKVLPILFYGFRLGFPNRHPKMFEEKVNIAAFISGKRHADQPFDIVHAACSYLST